MLPYRAITHRATMTETKLPTKRQQQAAQSRARATARWERRELLLEGLAFGLDRVTLARQSGLSLKTVTREIDRALDERRGLNTERFVRLQTERVHRALGTVEVALKAGDARVVGALVQLLDKLDRYHGLESRMADQFAPAAAPLALTRERTRTIAQAPEMAGDGSVPVAVSTLGRD